MAIEKYPVPENLTGLQGLMKHADNVVASLFAPFILLTIFIVAIMILLNRNYRMSDSCSLAALITLVLGAMLWAADLLQQRYLIISLVVLLLGVLWSLFDK